MTTATIKSMSVDMTLYPRNQIDDSHVADLLKALISGSTFPPIILDRSTNRIVDGVHRYTAYLRHLGEDGIVPVEYRDYDGEADFFIDAAKLNAHHGRKLDRHDQTRIVLRARELNIADSIIAATLHVPEPEVITLSVRVVYDVDGASVPQKRGLEHLRGQTLNNNQIEAMKSVRSAEAGRLCLELIKLLDNDLVDLEDERVHERMKQLAGVIAATLKRIRTLKPAKKATA